MTGSELVIQLFILAMFFIALALFLLTLKHVFTALTRMEAAAKKVAEDLSATASDLRKAAQQRVTMGDTLNRMEAETVVVAKNLAASVSRADATNGPEGAAADAALRTGDTAAAIIQRQDDAAR